MNLSEPYVQALTAWERRYASLLSILASSHYTLSTHPIDPLHQYISSTYSFTHSLNPLFQSTLSTHSLNPLFQPTLSIYPLKPPYFPTLSTYPIFPLTRYASGIGESFCDDCVSIAVERAESTRPTPTSLLPLHAAPSHGVPIHGTQPTHGLPLHGDGNTQHLLTTALSKVKDKDKGREKEKRTTTFGSSHHSQDSDDDDDETALTAATGLTTVHDHNQVFYR